MNMKRTIFAILLGFVALTKARTRQDCHKGCPGNGYSSEDQEIQELWQEDNIVCASNGKTYQNK